MAKAYKFNKSNAIDDYGLVDAHAHYISPGLYNAEFFTAQRERLEDEKKSNIAVDPFLDNWFKLTMSPESDKDAGLDCLLDDMRVGGIGRAVLASISEIENSEIDRVTRIHPSLFGMFWIDPDNPVRSLNHFLAARKENPRILGMKATFQYHKIQPDEARFFPLYEQLDDGKHPVQFHMGTGDEYSDLSHYARLAEHFQSMRIILLHGGGDRFRDMPALLAEYENIFVEFEALQLHEVESGSPAVLNYLLENCGSERLLFGSDWIWSEAKYFQRVAAFRTLLPEIQTVIGTKNALRILGIDGEPV